MKFFLIVLIIIIALIIIWSLVGYFTSNAEQAKYAVLKKADGYEIRNYPAHIVAQTVVEGKKVNGDAFNEGFRIIAGYIFGGNIKKESIAMTAPVIAQGSSEKIAMTVPVTASADGNAQVVSFGMPSGYTLATLPTPNDKRIKLIEVPEQKIAALRFSWYRTDTRFEKMKQQLFADLARDNVTIIGTPIFAGYNPPWTPPWMNLNEIMVQVH